MRKMFKGEKGFTLIELMIVIAILGILAAVAIPNFLNARGKAQDAAALSTLEAMKTSMEMYAADNGVYPVKTSVSELQTALGDNWPSNIKTDTAATGALVYVDSSETSYVVGARGRDNGHCFSLNQAGNKLGPMEFSALGGVVTPPAEPPAAE